MQNNVNQSIQKTKMSFEDSFESEVFYNQQTQDHAHLALILNRLKINAGTKLLDLGTGTGYLAFPIAQSCPEAEVTGLDIVEKALERNREKAESQGLKNLHFVSYGGLEFPFAEETFDIVLSRYALHHFPAVNAAFREVGRVLKPGGIFFLADPAPNDEDSKRFVDAYMQMKKDGHIQFYTKKEWRALGKSAGFDLIDGFETKIRFPRKRRTALEFDDIVKQFDQQVINGYQVEIIEDEIWITEKVNNLMFKK